MLRDCLLDRRVKWRIIKLPQQLDPNAKRFTMHLAQPDRPSAMRTCALSILKRMETMSSGVSIPENVFVQLSAELEDILLDLVAHTSLDRQDLIEFCAEHCGMER